jgi:hypothetical protein
MKFILNLFAIANARYVFPQPGGPNKRRPCVIFWPVKNIEYFYEKPNISSILFFTSIKPPI